MRIRPFSKRDEIQCAFGKEGSDAVGRSSAATEAPTPAILARPSVGKRAGVARAAHRGVRGH